MAKENPEKRQALIKAWNEEAERNMVLPLDDRTAIQQLGVERPSDEPARERYLYYLDTAPVPEGVAVNVRGRSFKILSNIETTDANASGVIFAHGSRFGGHALFVKGRQLQQPGKFTLSDDGLCVGFDSGDAVSQEYSTPGRFRGGTILLVGVTVEKSSTATSSRRHEGCSPFNRFSS